MYRLDDLNPMQREAAEHKEGPLLILAGAGSGKTRVLTYRIAHLIAQGVEPSKILAITFTNKAAKEMRERVTTLLGSEGYGLWVTTFHSACVRILRREIDNLPGYTKNFVIYDTGDQQSVIKACLKEQNYDEKKFPVRSVGAVISDAKNKLQDPEEFSYKAASYFEQKVVDIYRSYQKRLKSNNALDFDDIIMLTVQLFQQSDHVYRYYQDKFRYIMVDEYQDTNHAQYMLIKLLASEYRNLCVVGDDDQCILQGMQVSTPQGTIPIEDVEVNQTLICASGQGETIQGTVDHVSKQHYQGPVIKITTQTGKVIKATPNHIGFARVNSNPGVYYVYLMYKRGIGYRIGQTQGVRSRKGEIVNGLFVRLNGEHADKMWILKVCMDKAEAAYYEQLLSVTYGIPTMVFHSAGRKLVIGQEYIDKLFREVNTGLAAAKIMRDHMIFEEYPHHFSNAVIRGQSVRRIINVNFFAGRKSGATNYCSHRIALITSGEELKRQAAGFGFPVRNGQRNTWRTETERVVYDEADEYAKKLSQIEDGLEIHKKARLTDGESFRFMPFAHFRPTMSVPIYESGKIIEDVIEAVEVEDYDGYVYDLSVPEFRQFVCEGIVVHNSVYGWRGADIQNILDFERDYPEAKVIKLEQNYRSTQKILNAANAVVSNNESRKEKSLWTENSEGQSVVCYVGADERDEASYVVNRIQRLHELEGRPFNDFAILYRTNAQSRALEERLMKESTPYRVFSGLKFYQRMEIKDILAYLRVLYNPADQVSFARVLNVPKRSLGDTTLQKILEYANEQGMPVLDAILEAEYIPELTTRAKKPLIAFAHLMQGLISFARESSVSDLVEEILNKTGYKGILEAEDTPEAETRLQNLMEFLSVTAEYDAKATLAAQNALNDGAEEEVVPGLSGFLEQVSLVADIDELDQAEEAVALMTMHSAKGLEYPVVFVVGMEDGIFPSSRSLVEPAVLEEERRLCYVAITRAREKLYLCNTEMRMLYGKTQYNQPSRFLMEIPSELMTDIDPLDPPKRRPAAPSKPAGRRNAVSDRTIPLGSGSWEKDFGSKVVIKGGEAHHIGEKVEHATFGRGIIVSIKGEGNQAELTIVFDSGIKKLMAEYAKLTKL
ncbi:UvrD-helicase domain-containing protein [Desulfosporosinus lacus]|uniref:ATP-dependent DNA helicase PcrA n=1 Tax=Desulfosporosinus lacus DSM 15449 TaxID=1121420 RepID=A0A1M5ZVF0_9FIRM|nr:UvrD-helicase domain-containing protein [Desulfosporosinus lacus]SHI28128.1 DNA helicase-2 / ATP-dependent DNA helicase PcrA [Desulfosporosinus lacus DSM 15449]